MNENDGYTMPRRQFIGCLAGGGAALALGGLLPSVAEAAAPARRSHPGHWDERWLTRINGRHRQAFDAVSASNEVLGFAVNYMNSNKEAYGLADDDITTVIVLRHIGIPMAFSDDIWRRYKLGEMFKIDDPHRQAGRAQYLHQAAS